MYINAAKHKRKVANKTIGQQHQQNKLVERNKFKTNKNKCNIFKFITHRFIKLGF